MSSTKESDSLPLVPPSTASREALEDRVSEIIFYGRIQSLSPGLLSDDTREDTGESCIYCIKLLKGFTERDTSKVIRKAPGILSVVHKFISWYLVLFVSSDLLTLVLYLGPHLSPLS